MDEIKLLRMNIMGGMHSYVLALGDEELLNYWYAYGLPDEVTEEMLAEYAENDTVWEDVIRTFADVLNIKVY